MLNIYKSYIRPILEYGSIVWNMGYIGDLCLLERVQRRLTRAIAGLETLPYSRRLKILNLFSLKGRLLRNDLIYVWKIFQGLTPISPESLFILNDSGATRGHSYKIFTPRCNLDIRKRFFSVRIIAHWNALSNGTVNSDNLHTFKRLLQDDLGDILFEYVE